MISFSESKHGTAATLLSEKEHENMQAYAELIPPTTVSHAIAVPFVSDNALSLVVAKTSLLQVFDIKSLLPKNNTNYHRSNGKTDNLQDKSQDKLILVGEYPVSGIVTSLASVRIQKSKSGGHALLVAVRDAKFSIVQWDPEIHSLSTVSIHYYEGDEVRGNPWAQAPLSYTSYLLVDPSHRCAALKFGQRHLAVVPFHTERDHELDEYDSDLDDPRSETRRKSSVEEDAAKVQTPYGTSFVLQTTALDPAILDPIDLGFLHEYREPTIGVIYTDRSSSSAIHAERKDVVTYAAFTVDLEQRARTPLLAISSLPADIFKMMPLALPIGGTLLVGSNEIVHIDQSGKVFAFAVNEFAKEQTSLSMADQSRLDLELEGCLIHNIPSQPTDLLLVLASGDIAIIHFTMDGRTLSSISISRVSGDHGTAFVGGEASCAAALSPNTIFLGNLNCNSLLLKVEGPRGQLARKRSHRQMLDVNVENSSEDDEDDDDLYGNDTVVTKPSSSNPSARSIETSFTVCDQLPNLASLGDPILTPCKRRRLNPSGVEHHYANSSLQIAMPTVLGKSGGLCLLSQQIELDIDIKVGIEDCQRIWPLSIRNEHDNLIIATNASGKNVTSTIYSVNLSRITKLMDTDFETQAYTLYAGVLAQGRRLIQITESEFRSYDADIKLCQACEMLDEESETELKVCDASMLDPFLLVIRNDGSAVVRKADKKGELEELDQSAAFASTKWRSGSLHAWKALDAEASLFMLSERGGLYVSVLTFTV